HIAVHNGGLARWCEWCPEEDCDRAPKQLTFHANQQWKIAGTINSTSTPSGKGWISADIGPRRPSRLVVVRRSEAMVVVFAEQPLFLEARREPFRRQRRFSARQPALGEGKEGPEPALGCDAAPVPQVRHQPPKPVESGQFLQDLVEGCAASLL